MRAPRREAPAEPAERPGLADEACDEARRAPRLPIEEWLETPEGRIAVEAVRPLPRPEW